MIALRRTMRTTLDLTLDEPGAAMLLNNMKLARGGLANSLDIALDDQVFRRSQASKTDVQVRMIITQSTPELEVDRLSRQPDLRTVTLLADQNDVESAISRLERALETGYFTPGELFVVRVDGRRETDLLICTYEP